MQTKTVQLNKSWIKLGMYSVFSVESVQFVVFVIPDYVPGRRLQPVNFASGVELDYNYKLEKAEVQLFLFQALSVMHGIAKSVKIHLKEWVYF